MSTCSRKYTNTQYRQLRDKTEVLRRKGKSYKEIQKVIPVSKSTLSLWCKNIELTPTQIKRLGSLYDTQLRGAKANQQKSQKRKKAAQQQAADEIAKVGLEMFKIAGALLYWAEGSKTHHTAITNSDPSFIVFFVRWLKKALNIPSTKLQAHLHLHDGQNEKAEKKFWSSLTGIPLKNFGKTFYKPIGTGHRKNKLYHGTIRVRIAGPGTVLLRYKIFGWVQGFIRLFVPKDVMATHYDTKMGC